MIETRSLDLTFPTADGPRPRALRRLAHRRAGRLRLLHRAVGLREDDVPALRRGAGDAHRGDAHRQRDVPGRGAAGAGLWLRVPGRGGSTRGGPSAATSGCRWRSWASRAPSGRSGPVGRWSSWTSRGSRTATHGSSRGACSSAPLDRARARLRRRHPADGRALRRARRDRARPAGRGAAGALGAHGQDGALRHPLDPRGGLPVHPHRRHVPPARAASPTSSRARSPRHRPLDIRDTPEFIATAHRVRDGLRAGMEAA